MFQRLSIQQRFLLLLLPLALMVAMVCYQVKTQVNVGIDDLILGSHVFALAQKSQIAVADMGSGIKGFMLNPEDTSQLEHKKKADKNNAEALSQLRLLTADSTVPGLRKLNDVITQLEALDGDILDPTENEIAGLIHEKKFESAQQLYRSKYAPTRAKYDGMLNQLVSEVEVETRAIEISVRAALKRATDVIILSLLAGTALFAVFLIFSIFGVAKHLRASLGSLVGISGTLSKAADKISEQSESLLLSSTSISASLTETTATTTQLQQTVFTTSSAAAVSREKSDFCREKTAQGRDAVETAARSIREIQESNLAIRGAMRTNDSRFAEIIAVIGEIEQKTRVINEIVFQTKLLSFNASVEASRAGEHGKGFSVVATEIGNLATLSGNAASDISSMLSASASRVKTLVDDTRVEVQDLLVTADERVDRGMKTSQVCDEILQSIDEAVLDWSARTSEIAVATKQQATGFDELSRAINQISDGTEPVTLVASGAKEESLGLKSESESLLAVVDNLRAFVDGKRAA